ncbi:hypothetical protein MAR_027903 [Mya arenaria]|uniref:Uncharacterized protein n=1 Tax=Mya arenaria TaxID=6604 RepID=A0ABY7DE62_MYAAR|nr:hypothetical protein MAR_027903 [Mya arenaria]
MEGNIAGTEEIHSAMASSQTLMLVVVLVSLTLTSAGRRACKMDGETKTCVEVVGRRGALKGVSLCQKKGGTCMALQKGGKSKRIKCQCMELKSGCGEVSQSGSVRFL